MQTDQPQKMPMTSVYMICLRHDGAVLNFRLSPGGPGNVRIRLRALLMKDGSLVAASKSLLKR